ncbi:hypothetical protein RSOL_042670, partial [Rhizoctonia solani AG-3 Rhs1AP]
MPIGDASVADCSDHTYLTDCSHVICFICFGNVKIAPFPCGLCQARIDPKRVIRVYFDSVNGPLSDQIRELHQRVEDVKEENKEMRKTEALLKNRLAELTRMVDEEAEKLEKAIMDTDALNRKLDTT